MKNCFLIVNCNDYKSTKHLVDNIIDYKIIDEIVIVDNNSKESEKKLLENIKNKKITVIYNKENNGYSEAINIGSKYLVDKYHECNLVISNSDIVIMSEEDLIKMLELLNYESVGIVSPQILECGKIIRGTKSPSPIVDFFLNIPGFHHLIREHVTKYRDSYYETDTSVVDVISGCFFLISSEVMKKINYMDDNVFLYYEANIMCKKVRDLGLMILVANKVKIKHNYSISVDKNMKSMEKYYRLKESQYYFQTTYNNANRFERFLLRTSAKISSFFLRIWAIIKK